MKIKTSLNFLLIKLSVNFILQRPDSLRWVPMLWNLTAYFCHSCRGPSRSTSTRTITPSWCESCLSMILCTASHRLNWILSQSICPIKCIRKRILLRTRSAWWRISSILRLNIPLIIGTWLKPACRLCPLSKRGLFVWSIWYVSIILFGKNVSWSSLVFPANLTRFCAIKSNKV